MLGDIDSGDPCSIGVAYLWASVDNGNSTPNAFDDALHEQVEYMENTVPRLNDSKLNARVHPISMPLIHTVNPLPQAP